ncbi:MAG: hypothetical protein JST08_02890 [Actinobacteria bacterium]|nr:hypothetical protein [Actinomycetota bacterium]
MAGTRGLGRIVALVVGLIVALLLLLADAARAGTYEVAQCGWGVGVELDPAAPRTEGAAAYLHPGYCTSPPPGAGASLEFVTGLANDGEQGVARARWVAPPGTNFAAARFTWSGALGYAVWHVAGVADDNGFRGVAVDALDTPPHLVAVPLAGPAPAFEVRLECLILGAAYGCDRSRWSRMWLSGLTLTIDDPVPPRARLGGELVAGGWHRGTVPLELGGEDPGGAGLYREGATVDGTPVFTAAVACSVATIEGEVRATRLRPCPATASQAFAVDTTAFGDGAHTLQGCAVDFSGGFGCAPVQIQVDNSAPEVDFAAAPEGQVAATVSDAFSGPASGSIAMRPTDSESWTEIQTTVERRSGGTATLRAELPRLGAGAYFFRAAATDGAGNSGSAQFRAAGSPAEVRRQVAGAGGGSGGGPEPRAGGPGTGGRGRRTHLVVSLARAGRASRPGTAGSSLTVDFGSATELRGRLTDAHGSRVPGRAVVVVARATAGIGSGPERRRVVTDRAGRLALRLPPGPSRRVQVTFRGGGGFAPARARPLALGVRAAVSLAAAPLRLRTGESVTLSGRVRPGAARIPARGKLVTIQYRERASGRWRPALVVRTGGRGRFKARYRFRYVTGAARIRLRATALPEARWPYAAGSSAAVTVEVRG